MAAQAEKGRRAPAGAARGRPVARKRGAASVAVETPEVPPAPQLGSTLTIRDVRQIWPLLKELPEAAEPRLDVSGLTAIDTAGVQMLLVAVRELRSRGRELHLGGGNALLEEAVRALGLQHEFAALKG